MGRCVIIHGTMGSPKGNWIPWLANALIKLDQQVVTPSLPTPEGQSLDAWLAEFTSQVGEVDSSTTLIGHSVGAVFILRLLECLDVQINCAALVAGFTGELGLPEYDSLNHTFVDGAFDWAAISSRARQFICLSGANDPYVPIGQGLDIAKRIGVEPIIVPGGGHLNSEFGYTEFPLLLERVSVALFEK